MQRRTMLGAIGAVALATAASFPLTAQAALKGEGGNPIFRAQSSYTQLLAESAGIPPDGQVHPLLILSALHLNFYMRWCRYIFSVR